MAHLTVAAPGLWITLYASDLLRRPVSAVRAADVSVITILEERGNSVRVSLALGNGNVARGWTTVITPLVLD